MRRLLGPLLLFGLLPACSQEEVKAVEVTPRVKLFEVSERATGQSRRLSGKILATDRSMLSFGVNGRVEEIVAIQGQLVTKGQLLARLDEDNFRIQVEDARASVSNARAQLVESQTSFDRTSQLVSKKAASLKELDAARAKLAAAQSSLQSADGVLEKAELDLGRTKLTAPFAGQVVEVPIEPFQELAANELAVVLQTEQALEIEVRVPETLIRDVDFGQVVEVSFPTLEGVLTRGSVVEIGAEAEEGSAFRVAVRLSESLDGLRPGMTASVTFNYSAYLDGREAFLIPLSAIAVDAGLQNRSGEEPDPAERRGPVFVFDPQTEELRLQEILFGELRGNLVEVYEGLQLGDQIVSAGVPFLRDGMKVARWAPRK